MSIVPLSAIAGLQCLRGREQSKYQTRDSTVLVEDLNYATPQMGNRILAYYDPKFAINFERIMVAIENGSCWDPAGATRLADIDWRARWLGAMTESVPSVFRYRATVLRKIRH